LHKYLSFPVIVLVMVGVACNSAPQITSPVTRPPLVEQPTLVPSATPTARSTSTPLLANPAYVPPMYSHWITPGKVSIGNYYPGATAEYNLTIHNGSDGRFTETLQVTTAPGETTADIPIKNELAFPIKFRDVRVKSSNPGEHLTVTNYLLYLKHLTKVLTITGFAPDATRILTIEYVRPTVFSVYFRIPSETTKEYDAATTEQQDWVIIADSTPVFLPLETRDILIRLQMPKQAILGSRSWEFWVAVAESGAQGTIQTELASRWLVTMR